ncbi:MAG: hypothetical protein EZS28_005397 [Streblomastix strix]|uniref:Uncharacterized protein n=1 Tax=Streblomastix strix TaxID=222440 RepID=A0A5J4WVP4_9EUKA|nr:MAG: hypothetical protein EZS28_005397 [Streblomastix strix]
MAIIGWEGTNWVTAVLSDQTGGYILNTKDIDSSATDLEGFVFASVDGSDTSVIPPPSDCTGKTEEQCPCSSIDDTRPFCKTCTGKNQPSSECKCPTVAEGDYTKAQCDQDKGVIPPPADCDTKPNLPECSGEFADHTDKTEEQWKNLLTADCKCPAVQEGDSTKAKCEEDKKPSTADCTTLKKETPKEDCQCPDKTDKAKWDADPRTETEDDICASRQVHLTLSMITAAVVLPILALFFLNRQHIIYELKATITWCIQSAHLGQSIRNKAYKANPI